MAYDPNYDGSAAPAAGGYDTGSSNAPVASAQPYAAASDPNSAAATVAGYYQKYLGRAPENNDVVTSWVNGLGAGGSNLAAVDSAIQATPEAQAYKLAQSNQPAASSGGSAPPATGSPVTSTGQISPAVPAVAPPATPAQNGATPNEVRYVQPVPSLSTVPAYQATQFSTPTLSQFTSPDQSANNAQQSALMSAILTNPETMSPSVIAQLKETQKAQALQMAQQTQQGFDSDAASRGVLDGGFNAARSAANSQAANNQILNANTNTDITAAEQNRQDQLNALTASSSLAQDQLGRATSGYDTTLGGQTAQAQATLASQQAQAGENQYANSDALNRILSQFGINQGVATNAQQNYTTDISNSMGQNQQMLAVLQFLEGQREFNDTDSYNYTALDQNGQNSLLSYLSSLGG